MRRTSNINLIGFTVMELLVVLGILSIVISMGLLVINIVRSNFDKITLSNSNLIEIQDKDMKLSSFFLNSDTVFYDIEEKTLSSKNEVLFKIVDESLIDVPKDIILFDSIFNIRINFFQNGKNKKAVNYFSFVKQYGLQSLPFSYGKVYDIATKIHYPLEKSLVIK